MSTHPGSPRTNVLVVTPDVLGEKMAGPAIRAYEIAKALQATCNVTLVSTVGSTLTEDNFKVRFVDDKQLRTEVSANDVLIMQGHILSSHRWIIDTEIILVADIYDPLQLEILEQSKGFDPQKRIELTVNTVETLNLQIERADFMVCASEKQRDLWLGNIGAMGRLNPLVYEQDPSLRSLIDIAPFGIQDSPPQQNVSGIRGKIPGITQTDKVLIWGGGIYNWFDPLTLIRAIAKLSKTHPDLKLFFLGVQHPNPNVLEMHMVNDAFRLSDELEVTDKHVFFNSEWVDYEHRADYLLDADAGVSTHFDHAETAFSFRTRILDYIWAGLPIITTEGDTFAGLVSEYGLGVVVPPEDEDALAQAIERTLYSDEHQVFSQNLQVFRDRLMWSTTLRPIIEFCENPRHAADFGGKVVSAREQERQHYVRRISSLESSTSWRVTRPLRTLMLAMARVKEFAARRPQA